MHYGLEKEGYFRYFSLNHDQKLGSSATVWKLQNFTITQILREIKVGKTRVSKSAILTHWEALHLDFYDFLYLLKAAIHQINKIQSPKNGKIGNSKIPRLSKIDFT